MPVYFLNVLIKLFGRYSDITWLSESSAITDNDFLANEGKQSSTQFSIRRKTELIFVSNLSVSYVLWRFGVGGYCTRV